MNTLSSAVGAALGAVAVVVVGCGGSSSSPTSPTPAARPIAVVQATVSPNPIKAVLKNSTETSGTFEISADVIFRETAGTAVTITQVVGTVTRSPSGASTSGSLTVNLSLPALGSVSDHYKQTFEVTEDVAGVVWRLTASGTDAENRPVTVTAVDVQISPPDSPEPPTYGGGSARLLLYGGPGYGVYLGCFTCNQFDGQSIHNQFGKYGSRFSSTSIWNHYSQYGSQFASYSACNEFASSAPRLVNELTGAWAELTLNRFRPSAITDATVVTWLQRVVCER